MSNIEVKVGQVWQDNDRRRWENDKPMRVYVVTDVLGSNAARLKAVDSALTTGVKLQYMRGRAEENRRSGWSLVKDAE